MAGFTWVTIDYRGMGVYLRTSPDLRAAVMAHANKGAQLARAIAPVGPARDPHRGQFKASIQGSASTGWDGRIVARITADPVWVEFGRTRTHRYIGAHTLRKAAALLSAPRPGG
jgi:hypothetical protein